MNKEEKHKLMTGTNRKAQAQHNNTTQGDRVDLFKKDICKCKTCFKWLFYCAILSYIVIYTRFNRFQHCAINKDERDKPMSRTGREAQAELIFLRKIFAKVKNASNGSFIVQRFNIRDFIYEI